MVSTGAHDALVLEGGLYSRLRHVARLGGWCRGIGWIGG
jgi:hypothetical protein